MKANYSKGVSIAIISGIYIIAAAVGIFVFDKAVAVMPEVLALLLADVAATIITWGYTSSSAYRSWKAASCRTNPPTRNTGKIQEY